MKVWPKKSKSMVKNAAKIIAKIMAENTAKTIAKVWLKIQPIANHFATQINYYCYFLKTKQNTHS
jgi:hypothetical protein